MMRTFTVMFEEGIFRSGGIWAIFEDLRGMWMGEEKGKGDEGITSQRGEEF